MTTVQGRPAQAAEGATLFSERVFDLVAQQFGKDVHQRTADGESACGDDVCMYWGEDPVFGRIHVVNTTIGCCMARKVQVPTVEAGVFSILNKAAETTEMAVSLWNPSCR